MNRIKFIGNFIALTCLVIFLNFQNAGAQQPIKPTSGEIYKSLERLNFLGNVLFVAAHPDDENTRLISHLVNDLNAHTTYLSLTRGDGGQNLIGSETEELLGVIRTQELLQARKVDGGHQMFTRANDFGYSKNAEETISIWDNEQVKNDVVWAIRKTRPDVIINRFDHRTSGTTHGHHTASAMLSNELFEKASDKQAFSSQLKYVNTWEPSRLFFNVSWFFFGSQEAFNKADKSKYMSVEVGNYYPLLGKSNTEIAALSRSNHKCQGFGSTGTRGNQTEYLELIKGKMPLSKSDIFEGINTTWTRVKGGEKIGAKIQDVLLNFDYKSPHLSVPKLLEAYDLINVLEDGFWKSRKLEEISAIIVNCLGLYYDASTSTHTASPGENIKIDLEVIKRMPGDIKLTSISLLPGGKDTLTSIVLNDNENYLQTLNFQLPKELSFTNAYWLNELGSPGMYKVSKEEWIGAATTPREIKVKFGFQIGGRKIFMEREVSNKYNSPEDGEKYLPFEVTPEVFVDFEQKVYLFQDEKSKKIKVAVKAGKDNVKGKLSLLTSEGWKISPAFYEFELISKMGTAEFVFDVVPPMASAQSLLTPIVDVDGRQYNKKMIEIKYDHIPGQVVMLPSVTNLVRVDVKKVGQRIAYIKGAGDEVAPCLRQLGYLVDEMEANEIFEDKIKNYDAIVMGIRAYNTKEALKFKQGILLDYVKNGGNLILQYNTNNGIFASSNLGPYPFKISRDRVAMEDAEIRILAPEHPILNYPNKIIQNDFEEWVQERGLYFASEWDQNYTPVISCNDTGESAKDSGILVTKYGSGNYIYTSMSWFRQLPSGVSGAYKLFANILSMGKEARP